MEGTYGEGRLWGQQQKGRQTPFRASDSRKHDIFALAYPPVERGPPWLGAEPPPGLRPTPPHSRESFLYEG